MSYGTDAASELSPPLAEITGRRVPGARIIYQGGTPGPRGPVSSASFRILGKYATVGALPAGASAGDAYLVDADDHIYVWNANTSAWDDIGLLNVGIQSPDGSIANAIALTQVEYDAIVTPDPLTIYFIKQT